MALRPMLLALLSSFTAASENFTDCGAGVGMNQLTCCDQSDFNVTRDIARSTHCHGLVTSFDFKSDADCRKVFGIPDAYKFPSKRTTNLKGEGRCVARLPLVEAGLRPREAFANNGVLHKCKQGVRSQLSDCDVLGVMGLSQVSLSAGVHAYWHCFLFDNQTRQEQCPLGWELWVDDQESHCVKRSHTVVGTGEPYDPLHPPGGGHPPGGVPMGLMIFVLLFGICSWGAQIPCQRYGYRRGMKQGAEGGAPSEVTLSYTRQTDDHAERLGQLRAEILQERQQHERQESA